VSEFYEELDPHARRAAPVRRTPRQGTETGAVRTRDDGGEGICGGSGEECAGRVSRIGRPCFAVATWAAPASTTYQPQGVRDRGIVR
jgi:hypothetical protein